MRNTFKEVNLRWLLSKMSGIENCEIETKNRIIGLSESMDFVKLFDVLGTLHKACFYYGGIGNFLNPTVDFPKSHKELETFCLLKENKLIYEELLKESRFFLNFGWIEYALHIPLFPDNKIGDTLLGSFGYRMGYELTRQGWDIGYYLLRHENPITGTRMILERKC